MAEKYSDIITIRGGKIAYNIQDEEQEAWKDFIANDQFNGILKTVIKSVSAKNIDDHKSFWIEGTYGTGKSHAGAVIKHLLCDEIAQIKDYVEEEYKDERFKELKSQIWGLREKDKKRLFPVMLYGQANIARKEDLSLQLQRAISDALRKAGIHITVKTDFENLCDHIDAQPEMWNLLIMKSPQLKSVAPTVEKLKSKLLQNELGTYGKVMDAQRNAGIDVRMESSRLKDWFFEVQDELARSKDKYGYDGLLVIWDEFTEVMTSELGASLLVSLQEIDENVMNLKNNSYFLYISHPSALNTLSAEERDKTKGRYHYMRYQMESISAFKIMSRKFKLVNGASEEDQLNLASQFYKKSSNLLDIYSSASANPEETKQDLKKLFPLHPSTANLATYYAREVGSSSRSVFEFIGSNDAVRAFLDDENHFLNRDTITAEYLWDYVQEIFNANVQRYGVVTERYNSRHLEVEHQGDAYLAVFKSVLLLNALNNIAHTETVTPSGNNIGNLYAGTSLEPMLEDILKYFDEKGIIQCLPSDEGGLYEIRFSALPAKDIEEKKEELRRTAFKYAEQLLNFNDTANREIGKWITNISRPFQFKMLSAHDSEHLLLNKIENYSKSAKPYEVFIAMLFGKSGAEIGGLKELVEKAVEDERFANIVFVVYDTPLGEKSYERFIEFMANADCASKYNQPEQQRAHTESASAIIKEWLGKIRQGLFQYYRKELSRTAACVKMASTFNEIIVPNIFGYGPESLENLRKVPKTFWEKKSSKTIVDNVLSFDTKPEIIERCTGPMNPFKIILQDGLNENLEWMDDADKNHPLYLIEAFIDKKFKHTTKSEPFNMGDRLKELTYPPFGLYQSYAGMGMVAFAMRKWVKQIFDLNGKPRDVQSLVEDVVEMFKAWENDRESNKLNFRFETKESRSLCESFIKLFNLGDLKDYSDVSSLTDARTAIKYGYLKEKGFPLWSLKYVKTGMKPGMQDLIDNILKILATDNTRDPNLLKDTSEGITVYRFDFKNLLNASTSFSDGFLNFMLAQDGLNFKEDEFDEALEYLIQHLQNDRGLWSEEEVLQELNKWRSVKSQAKARELYLKIISTAKREDEISEYLENDDPHVRAAAAEKIEVLRKTSSATTASKGFVQKKKKALGRVDKITKVAEARRLLKLICESEVVNEGVLDLINDYDA
ncbi:MAG: hypothetical protein NC048_04120 [Bacteroides sp.]|nr:hypothetical protein [Ruminococcus flavefaciens]MCM1554662.1 hypothetical protein [Bacteroides sp.]